MPFYFRFGAGGGTDHGLVDKTGRSDNITLASQVRRLPPHSINECHIPRCWQALSVKSVAG